MIPKTYTTAGHFPRSSRLSAFTSHVDIVYNVYKESATSTPDQFNILLLHGSQLVKEVWNYQIELLFQHYGSKLDRIITVDALNSGDSALANEGRIGWYHTWEDLALDHIKVIEDIIKRDGLPGPLFAMGHSMGGAETLFLASRAPFLFAGAILLDPVWGADNLFAVPEALPIVAKVLGGVRKRAEFEFPDQQTYSEFVNKKFVSTTFHPRIKADIEKFAGVQRDGKYYLKSTPEQQAGAYGGCATLAGHSITTFAYAPIPILVVYGENEDWNPPGSNDELAEMLPRGETAVVKDGGHLVFYERPEATLEAIYPFLDRTLAEYKTSSVDPKDPSSFNTWLGLLKRGESKL